MTHYIKRYSFMTPQHAHNCALLDIEDYLGADRFTRVNRDLCNARDAGYVPTLEAFELLVSFAGVQGYPARAWYAEIWPYG